MSRSRSRSFDRDRSIERERERESEELLVRKDIDGNVNERLTNITIGLQLK
jgi:hypothetical protein